MRVTKDFIESEVEALNELLPVIYFKAYAEVDEQSKPYIGLMDTDGPALGDVESERFYSAREALERLDHYFEESFLQGEILCDEPDKVFDTYEEAEAYARKVGYSDSADSVKLYLSFFTGSEQVVFQTKDATYLLTQEEIDIAHEYGKRQEAYELVPKAIERLVLGDLSWLLTPKEITDEKREQLEELFQERFGFSSTAAAAYYTEDIVDRFLEKYSPYEDWSAASQAYFYAMEVLDEKRKEKGGKNNG